MLRIANKKATSVLPTTHNLIFYAKGLEFIADTIDFKFVVGMVKYCCLSVDI